MLILSRKHGERVLLGTDIVIQVVSLEGGRVRLGFEAPAGMAILREEIAGGPARTPGPERTGNQRRVAPSV
jgi:carbon storage regulator